MTQHDKLFALYAANIAGQTPSKVMAYELAREQLVYFDNIFLLEEQESTPPAQEETFKFDYAQRKNETHWVDKQEETLDAGIWIARLEDGYRMQTVAKDRGYKIQQLIADEFAEILVGPMTLQDEPRKVKTIQ